MFGESIDAVLKGAESKLGFMKSNPLGYFMASAIAGMFITFGSMISMSIGGYLTALMGPAAKIGAAIAFAAALSMVITAGCELFTGNNLTVGMLGIDKPRRWGEIAGLWAYCWLGNLVGSWITIAVYHYAGADTVACVSQYFAKVSASKVSFTPLQMVLRGILAQHLVPSTDGSRRWAVTELLVNTPGIANQIATGRTSQIPSAIETGGNLGMRSLEDSLATLLRRGCITERAALAITRNPETLRRRLYAE